MNRGVPGTKTNPNASAPASTAASASSSRVMPQILMRSAMEFGEDLGGSEAGPQNCRSVTAPSLAVLTVAAYLASTPRV